VFPVHVALANRAEAQISQHNCCRLISSLEFLCSLAGPIQAQSSGMRECTAGRSALVGVSGELEWSGPGNTENIAKNTGKYSRDFGMIIMFTTILY